MKRMPVANFPAMLLTVALIAVSPIPSLAYADDPSTPAPEQAEVAQESEAVPEDSLGDFIMPTMAPKESLDTNEGELAAASEMPAPDETASLDESPAEGEGAVPEEALAPDDAPAVVDVDGSGWPVGPLGPYEPDAQTVSLDGAKTTELEPGYEVLFAAELTYGIQVDGRAVAEPVRAELYFPAGGTPVGETVTVAFYPVEGDPLMLAATVTGDCAGESAGALVTVMFDGEGFTLNDQAVASVDGRYEVIVRTEEPQTEEPQAEEPDEESLLAEELAQLKAELEQARAGLDGTAVLEEEALADAADGTVYATEASAAAFAEGLDAIKAKLDAGVTTLEDAGALRQELAALGEKFQGSLATVTVDRAELETALADADELRAGITASADGKDVLHGAKWASNDVCEAFDAVLAEARAAYEAEDATQNRIDGAVAKLAEARTALEADLKVAEVTRAALDEGIKAAASAPDGVTVSDAILDVAPGARWVRTADAETLAAAIATAKGTAEQELATLTQNDVDAATAALAKAVEAYKASVMTKPAIEDLKISRAEENVGRDIVHVLPAAPIALRAVFTPADAAVAVSWSSSDPQVAAIDSSGKVTAVGDGAATITVTSRAFEGQAESRTATFTVVSIGCGDAWTYSSTATGVTVEGAPSGVDIESQIVTGSSGFPVGSLGSGDRAVAGVLVTLTTPLGDTLVGVPVDGMSARIPVGTDAYDGQEVEVALYGDDGCTYTYTPVVHDGMVYLAIPAGGYIEVIARADLLKAAVPEDGEDPAKPGDATTSDDDVRERLAQTGDGSAAAIVAAGLAGAAALAAGAIVLRRSRRS